MRRFGSDESGQTVVIVALLFVMILGFTGLAVDGGRFYTERRFLQNAADAAALGCANKLLATGNQTTAEDTGKEILRSYNLRNDPTGTTVVVPDAPVYTTWYNAADPTDKRNLYEGVDAYTQSCRVGIRASMHTYFMGMLGFQSIDLSAYGHAAAKGGMLPVVVNRYKDPPGPSSTFLDYSKREVYQNLNPNVCGESGAGNCPDAARSELGCNDNTCLWGPETVIVGNGYDSSDSDFRGFIALDIRDFTNASHLYYNGVTDQTNVNALKDKEAAYVIGGYPGPDLEAYIPNSNPVQAGLQIATMAGNSTGIVVENFDDYFNPGDTILIQYFDGQVREIPDFTITPPSVINATANGVSGNGPSFRVGANQRFRDANSWVTLSMVQDSFAGGNDTPSQLETFTFAPGDPAPPAPAPGEGFTPAGGAGTSVQIQDLKVNTGLATGIYSVIIEGTGYEAPKPTGAVIKRKKHWIPLNVGGVTKDFAMNFVATTVEASGGADGIFEFTLTTGTGTSAWGTSAVTVALDSGGTVPCTGSQALVIKLSTGTNYCVTPTITSTGGADAFVPKKNPDQPTVTVRIPTGALGGAGLYSLMLRSRGTNSSGQPVVHVQPLTLAVDQGTGTSATKYVNVQGYGVFMITVVETNAVLGRAISGYFASPNDPALNIARRAGLLPWEVAPY